MDNISSFTSSAKGLTRNPLGIIALFISLIYGFACLVLSTSIDNLHSSCERLPLIWFIIIFPVVILIAFIYLVIFHHEKLYSPSDFRGDESFIQTIDKKKIKEKQLKEIQALETSQPTNVEVVNKEIDTQTAVEDDNRTNKVEVVEKTKTVDEAIATVETLESKNEKLLEIYSKSEKWVAQELSLKYKLHFRRNIAIKTTAYGRFELDGLGQDGKRTYIIETKYWEADKSEKKLKVSIQEFLNKRQKLERIFKGKGEFKLIIALVFDRLANVNQTDLVNFVTSISPTSEVEFFEFGELKKQFE